MQIGGWSHEKADSDMGAPTSDSPHKWAFPTSEDESLGFLKTLQQSRKVWNITDELKSLNQLNVVHWKSADVPEEHVAFIFGVEE
jgi:hypothetical protein